MFPSDLADDENPFQSPQVAESESLSAKEKKYARLGHVFVTWEKLRIVYNAVLTAVVLLGALLMGFGVFADGRFIEMLIFGCLGANFCYLLGPVIDGYATWFGIRHLAVTIILFVLGTVLSVLLTTGCLLSYADWPP